MCDCHLEVVDGKGLFPHLIGLQTACSTSYESLTKYLSNYLSTDYFGTQQIIFGNNMNTIEMHLILSSPWLTDLPVGFFSHKYIKSPL